MKIKILSIFVLLALFLTACVESNIPNNTDTERVEVIVEEKNNDFITRIKDGFIEIVSYRGSDTHLVIPDSIDGLPVRFLSNAAFQNSTIQHLVVPETVKYMGQNLFAYTDIQSIRILGDVPFPVGPMALNWCDNRACVNIYVKQSFFDEVNSNSYTFIDPPECQESYCLIATRNWIQYKDSLIIE
jgi:hypothetical protein